MIVVQAYKGGWVQAIVAIPFAHFCSKIARQGLSRVRTLLPQEVARTIFNMPVQRDADSGRCSMQVDIVVPVVVAVFRGDAAQRNSSKAEALHAGDADLSPA